MQVAVITYQGQDTGRKVDLPEAVFGIEPSEHAVYLDVCQILAGRRQGTHKTKEKSEVRGSTRKIRKQKHTGYARAGAIRSPLFKGGGRIFGPKPRDYSFKVNKKLKQLARKSVLSYKAKQNHILVLEDFTFEQPKTKHYLALLTNLALQDHKTLLVLPRLQKDIVLAGRNLPYTQVATVDHLNTYDLARAQRILVSESAIPLIQNQLS